LVRRHGRGGAGRGAETLEVRGGLVDDETFWALIDLLDWRHDGDDERVVKPLVERLASMPDAEIGSFHETLAQKLYDIDGRAWARESGPDIWSGDPDRLSVDGFLYARSAVVGRGQEVYDAVRAEPALMPKNAGFEALLYVAANAYERKTGLEFDEFDDTEVSYETFSNEAGWPNDT
jgi:hypothetical protein